MSTIRKNTDFIYWMEKSESTMDEAQKIPSGKNWFLVSSKIQSRGRGTQNRQWESRSGNGFMTIGVSSNLIPPDRKPLLPMEVSIVLYTTICGFINSKYVDLMRIKWPNDILFNQKKAAGILIERNKDYFLIGIGINISSVPFIHDGGREACCLNQFGMDPKNRKNLLTSVFINLKSRLSKPYSKEIIREDWMKYVRWEKTESLRSKPGEKIKPMNINEYGQLLVRHADGTETWLTSEYLI